MTAEQQKLMEEIHEVNFQLLSELDRLCRKYDVTYYLAFGGLLGAVRHGDFIPWDNDVDIVITREEFAKLEPHFNELGEAFEYIAPSDYGKKYFDMVPRINYKHSAFHMFPEKDAFYENKSNKIALDFFFIDGTWNNWKGKVFRYWMMILYGMANAHRYRLELECYEGVFKVAAVCLWAVGKVIPASVLRKWIEKSVARNNKKKDAPGYVVTNDTIASFGKFLPKTLFDGYAELEIRGKKFMVPKEYRTYLEIEYGDYMKLPPVEKRVPHYGPYLLDFDKIVVNDCKK